MKTQNLAPPKSQNYITKQTTVIPIRTVILARVSTTEQVTNDQQIKELTKKCQELNEEVIKVIEEKHSVKAEENEWDLEAYIQRIPALKEIIQLAEQKQFNKLFVWKFDRLSRGMAFQDLICRRLQDNGITIESLMEGKERLVRQIHGLVSEQENADKSQRVLLGLRNTFSKNKPISRPPTGYTLTGTKLKPNKDADLIRKVFETFIKTKSINQVRKQALKKPYTTIKYILTNRTYLGELRMKDQTIPNAHEPIITQETFNKAQEILQDKK